MSPPVFSTCRGRDIERYVYIYIYILRVYMYIHVEREREREMYYVCRGKLSGFQGRLQAYLRILTFTSLPLKQNLYFLNIQFESKEWTATSLFLKQSVELSRVHRGPHRETPPRAIILNQFKRGVSNVKHAIQPYQMCYSINTTWLISSIWLSGSSSSSSSSGGSSR